MLSDSPPDRDLEWTHAGVAGAYRFVQRVSRLVLDAADGLPPVGAPRPGGFGPAATALRQACHRAIDGVSADIEAFHFNRAVARVHELANAIGEFSAGDEADGWALREALQSLIALAGPMMPHLGEEMWQALGHDGLLADHAWPEAEPALLVEDTVTIPVQVNGKLRARVDMARGAANDDVEAAALADDNVRRAIDGKAVRKVIVVPDKIVNIVVA
jgi:leucyl-tRNA synthetase